MGIAEDIATAKSQAPCAACVLGAFSAALESIKRETGVQDSLVELKLRVRGALAEACGSGDLQRRLRALPTRLVLSTGISFEADRGAVKGEPGQSLAVLRCGLADLLADACDSGVLAATLGSVRTGPHASNVEDVRAKMKACLLDASQDGSLDTILRSRVRVGKVQLAQHSPPRLSDPGVRTQLQRGMEDGPSFAQSEVWLRNGAAQEGPTRHGKSGQETGVVCSVQAPHSSAALVVACPAARATAPRHVIGAWLEMLSNVDRRIGFLRGTIAEVRQRIAEQEERSASIEEEIRMVRQDLKSLDSEVCHKREAIGEVETSHLKLQQTQRKLVGELQAERLKQRHAAVDLGAGVLLSVSSEVSTACTVQGDLC